MEIKQVIVGYLETNCYVVYQGNDCIVIDPGDEIEKIISAISNKNLKFILITHYHFDHIGALEELKQKYKVPVYDINNLEEKEYNIDNFNFEIIYTKGHKDDSITIYFKKEKIMFTGDFLFKGSIGRTDFEDSNQKDMIDSLIKIKTYPDDIKIYPGHGEDTMLGYEKQNNYFLKNI